MCQAFPVPMSEEFLIPWRQAGFLQEPASSTARPVLVGRVRREQDSFRRNNLQRAFR